MIRKLMRRMRTGVEEAPIFPFLISLFYILVSIFLWGFWYPFLIFFLKIYFFFFCITYCFCLYFLHPYLFFVYTLFSFCTLYLLFSSSVSIFVFVVLSYYLPHLSFLSFFLSYSLLSLLSFFFSVACLLLKYLSLLFFF